jgi:hypothetical protein
MYRDLIMFFLDQDRSMALTVVLVTFAAGSYGFWVFESARSANVPIPDLDKIQIYACIGFCLISGACALGYLFAPGFSDSLLQLTHLKGLFSILNDQTRAILTWLNR